MPTMDPWFQQQVLQWIHHRTGIVIHHHQLNNLNQTLQQTLEQFKIPTHEILLKTLQSCSSTDPIMEFLISRITVGESYFFRDEKQIDFFRDVCIPSIIKIKQKHKIPFLRLWSAGCSDGQEAITLAILLREALPDLEQWGIHLMATDLNMDSLSRAKSGLYPEWSFRATSQSMRTRYFIRQEQKWKIRDQLKKMVNYAYLNLIEDPFPSVFSQTQAMDLIVCRNVFIYFDLQTVTLVLKKMVDCLVPGGYLVLGASDVILENIPGCTTHLHDGLTFYRRDYDFDDKNSSSKHLVDYKPSLKSANYKPIPFTPSHLKSLKPIPSPIQKTVFERMILLASQESWLDLLEAFRDLPETWQQNPLMLQLKAKALVNMGDSEQTIQLCQQSLAINSTDKHLYLIMGMASMELEQITDAESSFRRALFLDRNFMECHFQLGLLLLRSGRTIPGSKSIKNALHLANKHPSGWLVHNASGMTFGRFANVIQAELSLYEKRI